MTGLDAKVKSVPVASIIYLKIIGKNLLAD